MEITYLIGFALCALAYLVSTGLVFSSKATGTIRSTFILTFLAMVAWSLFYGIIVSNSTNPFVISPILESLNIFVWLTLLLAIIQSDLTKFRQFIKSKYVLTLLVLLVVTNILLASDYLSREEQYKLVVSLNLLSCIGQLILLEQIFRHSDDEKWAFKPLILGLAAVNIYTLVMMSNSLLLNRIDPQYLAARPFIYTIIVPFVLLTMKRANTWNLRIFISREVVLHSSLLSFAGVYLLVMAIAGYYLQQTGQVWSGIVQIVFVAGAMLMLAYIFISDSVRNYFKTFIQKHFYANQFEYRDEWLNLTAFLDNADKASNFYQVGVEGICNSMQYEYGAYYKVTENQLEIASNSPFTLSLESNIELKALVAKVRQNKWLMDISDFDKEEYKEEFPNYQVSHLCEAGVEIILPIFIEEKLHGVFLLSSQTREKIELNWEVRDYLTTIASQIASYFRFNEAQAKLEENAKFAAFNRMSAFVVHDLKNVIAQIGMIVSNGEKYRHIPEFIDDTFETLEHTKERMDRMLSQLKEKQQQRSLLTEVELNSELQSVVDEFSRAHPKPTFSGLSREVPLQTDQERFRSVIGHLIDNAQHATDDDGEVTVHLLEANGKIKLSISDSGIGMSEDFINNQLFKPFETTKGNAGMGVGVYEAKTFAEEFGGVLTVESQLGKGTTFQMTLPTRK